MPLPPSWPVPSPRRPGALLLACLAFAAACSSDSTGPADDPDPVPEGPATLQVVVSTDGNGTDDDGYTITLDNGSPASVGASQTLQFDNLDPGSHTVAFAGDDGRCFLRDDRVQTRTLTAGQHATLQFRVRCFRRPVGFESDVTSGGFIKVRVVDDDGTFATTFGAGSVSVEPNWSPTGALAYGYGDETTGLSQLRLALGETLGASIRNSGQARPLTWSGDGSRLVALGNGGFLLVNPATGTSSPLTLPGDPFGSANAATAPDGTRLLLNPLRFGEPGSVFIASFDGAVPVQIGDPDHDYQCYSWSADGTEVYCVLWTGPGQLDEIVALDVASGAERTILIPGAVPALGAGAQAVPLGPTPDGGRIVLSMFSGSDESARNSIYTVRPDGTDLIDLTAAPAQVFDRVHVDSEVARWSPETDELVFIRCDQRQEFNCPTALWAVAGDGTGLRKIFDIEVPGSGTAAQWIRF